MTHHPFTKHFALAYILAFSAGTCASAQGPAFTTIDFPGASNTFAWAINSHGDVAGLYVLPDNSRHGFVYSGGRLTPIDYPGASSTNVYGINNRGDVVGDYTINGAMHGFLLSEGRFSTIEYPGATGGGPAAINEAGEITGAYNLPDNSLHSFLLSGSQFTNLDFPGATSNQGNGINSLGDIVSSYTLAGVTHGLLVSNGKFTSIDVPGSISTGAYGINSSGSIVGRYRDTANSTHAFLLSNGAFTTFDIPGATYSFASAINSSGDIAGRYISGGVGHAFIMTSPAVRYTVTDLGVLPGGSFSQASQGNTDNGLIAGVSDTHDGAQHATLWYRGLLGDLATTGLGGPNSIAVGLNARGQVVGAAETAAKDPENFCAYDTGLQCLAFLWQDGVMRALPTLGGKNATASTINIHGEAVGLAENTTRDPSCPAPQVFDYEAVAWGPKPGQIRELRPLPGDTVGVAFWINDRGQAVGTSGLCSNTLPSGVIVGPHAVLWEADGSVVDLGNLGGSVNTELVAIGNRGIYINNHGEVVGGSALAGNKAAHAFLWNKDTGMRDLGVLPGDTVSGALGMNERGEVVGVSNDPDGNPRAFLWRNGAITDLNDMVPADSPLFLLFASGINSRGVIVGFGVTGKGDVHAFQLTPNQGDGATVALGAIRPVLSEQVRKQVQRRMSSVGGRNR